MADDVVENWLERVRAQPAADPHYNPILNRPIYTAPPISRGGGAWAPNTGPDPEVLKKRLELRRRGVSPNTWTDALSGLYVNQGERDRELKNILDDYIRSGGIDEESMGWLEGLPRKEKGWLYGKRGPTEASLAELKEDLIWEAAAVRAARQRDLEREAAKQAEEPQKATRE